MSGVSARISSANAAAEATRGVRLVADVGGTNARFATVGTTAVDLERIAVLPCADFPHVKDAIDAYLTQHGINSVEGVAMAVAGPVDGEWIDLPNNRWTFSTRSLEESLGVPLTVLNDFTAQMISIDALGPDDVVWLGSPRVTDRGIRAVLGPGTGLGVAMQMPDGQIVPSEGGHVGFAPFNEHEIDILQTLLGRFSRVSIERVLSGPGLENIFWANHQLVQPDTDGAWGHHSARDIGRLAADGDPVAIATIRDFFDIYASFAGDVALHAWATGGVYLSGGVTARLADFFDMERFRARFEDKGRFTRFCETVPLAWVTHPYPGLVGCAATILACDVAATSSTAVPGRGGALRVNLP